MATTLATPPASAVLPDLAGIRRAKGISLSQISETTKIGMHYLEAIEESRFDQLPGGVFATSYIRQYARAIEFDEWDLLACYSATTEPPAPVPERAKGFMRSFPEWCCAFWRRSNGSDRQ